MNNEEWNKGNCPLENGLYWITFCVAGRSYVLLADYDMSDNKWHKPDSQHGTLAKENITAYSKLKAPKPYNPDRIGFADEFYIKVVDQKDNVYYYSKQLTPINWSDVGYSSAEKAANAAKRDRRIHMQEYPLEKRNYYVVTGNNEVVKIIAEDI